MNSGAVSRTLTAGSRNFNGRSAGLQTRLKMKQKSIQNRARNSVEHCVTATGPTKLQALLIRKINHRNKETLPLVW
jgi:hypothetical protein